MFVRCNVGNVYGIANDYDFEHVGYDDDDTDNVLNGSGNAVVDDYNYIEYNDLIPTMLSHKTLYMNLLV